MTEKTCRSKAAVKGTWEKVDKGVDFALAFRWTEGPVSPLAHKK